MTVSTDFYFDFASPNAYLSYRLLPGIAERTGVQMNIVPCLLGGIFKATGNQAPMISFGNVKGKLAYTRLEMQRFIKRHKLSKFRMNEHFPVNTLMLMRGAIVAQQDDRLADYLELGLQAMWEDSLKMDDPGIYAKALTAGGFDGAAYLERMNDPVMKEKLVANTAQAVERGVFGIPTFFVGDEMYFGKENLILVEEEILAQRPLTN